MQITNEWRKSSKSGPYSDNCVEVRRDGEMIQLRDTKDAGNGPILSFTKDEWIAFVGGVEDGEFEV